MRHLQLSVTLVENVYDHTGTLILIWTEDSDSEVYRAEIPNSRLPPLGLEHKFLSNAIGERIPKDHFLPPWYDALTEIQQPVSPDVFLKKHYGALLPYDGTPGAQKIIMTEVNALEIVSKKPHPNVNKYLGCIRDGDFVGGICLEKLDVTLRDLVNGKIPEDRAPPFQPDIIISGIKAGIDHIHSFGLVHDDINPTNIMLDQAGNPVIIDFDSCVPVGTPSVGGTPGWSRKPTVAAFENDFYSFDLVVKFIRGEYDGRDVDEFFGDKPRDQPENSQDTAPDSC